MIDTQIRWGLWKENLSQEENLFMTGFIVTDEGPLTFNKNLFKEKIYFSLEMKSDAIRLKPNPLAKNTNLALGNVFYPIKQFSNANTRTILLEINKFNNCIPVTGPSIFNIHSKSDLICFSFDQAIELKFQNEKPVDAELIINSFTLSCN